MPLLGIIAILCIDHANCEGGASYIPYFPVYVLVFLSDDRRSRTAETCCTKGKAVPLQAWRGPEGSRKLSFLYFVTTAQNDGKVLSLTHRPPLPPGNAPGTHLC